MKIRRNIVYILFIIDKFTIDICTIFIIILCKEITLRKKTFLLWFGKQVQYSVVMRERDEISCLRVHCDYHRLSASVTFLCDIIA